MSFDFTKSLKSAFQNKIYKSSSKEERKKEIIKLVLKALSDKPERIVGFLRFQGVKQKVVQFLTQSFEIKTGDMLEEFFTSLFGFHYTNLTKNINGLKCDQLFQKNENGTIIIYLIEQKIRDDHDSTKKNGQVENFEHKISALRAIYPNALIRGYEWFIDDSFKKYPDFYKSKFNEFKTGKEDWFDGGVFYGGDLINTLCGPETWEKFVDAYNVVKKEFTSDIGTIIGKYDFDNDPLDVVLPFYKNKREKGLKIFFDSSYEEVRTALFSGGMMEDKLMTYFMEKKTKTAAFFLEQYKLKHGGE
jgi:hypothetical protein